MTKRDFFFLDEGSERIRPSWKETMKDKEKCRCKESRALLLLEKEEYGNEDDSKEKNLVEDRVSHSP